MRRCRRPHHRSGSTTARSRRVTARLTLNVGAVQMRAGDTIVEGMRRADLALDDARNHRHGRPVGGPSLEDTVALQPPPGELEPKTV